MNAFNYCIFIFSFVFIFIFFLLSFIYARDYPLSVILMNIYISMCANSKWCLFFLTVLCIANVKLLYYFIQVFSWIVFCALPIVLDIYIFVVLHQFLYCSAMQKVYAINSAINSLFAINSVQYSFVCNKVSAI